MAHFLVTRPAGKGEQLAQTLAGFGHQVSQFSLLSLNALDVPASALTVLDDADIVIFISQDAVRFLSDLNVTPSKNAHYFAVGEQTARALKNTFNISASVAEPQNTEGLLAFKALNQVDSKHVVIVKGKDGRPDLAKTLKQRGAILNQLALYERFANPLLTQQQAEKWQNQGVTDVILTSNASIDALFGCAQDDWLATLNYVVVSERSKTYLQAALQQRKIKAQGRIINSEGANDDAILASLTITKELKPAMAQEKDITEKSSLSENKPVQQPVKTKASGNGVAYLALLVALLSAGGAGFAIWQWQTAQHASTQLGEQNQLLSSEISNLKQQLQATERSVKVQQQTVTSALNDTQTQLLQQVEQQLMRSQQVELTLNPQEVASLVRMAEFKAYSERQYQAAIGILQKLDGLLAAHSGTQAVREAIHKDIQTLNGISRVPSEEIYLTLHGLIGQVDGLPLNMVQLSEIISESKQEQLSQDVSDWRANLARSWQQLTDSFITIRERSAPIEPLLDEREQSLVRLQLSFFLAQAQNALMSEQKEVFSAAIASAQKILASYFKQDETTVSAMQQQLSLLADMPLNFAPEFSLGTGKAVSELQ